MTDSICFPCRNEDSIFSIPLLFSSVPLLCSSSSPMWAVAVVSILYKWNKNVINKVYTPVPKRGMHQSRNVSHLSNLIHSYLRTGEASIACGISLEQTPVTPTKEAQADFVFITVTIDVAVQTVKVIGLRKFTSLPWTTPNAVNNKLRTKRCDNIVH